MNGLIKISETEELKSKFKALEIRPPVIGQENTESSSEDALSCDNIPAALMQSQINQKPPSLPPKPRIGSGMASTPSRGPPPPVTPRTSSLLPNQTGKSDSPDPSSSSAVELSDTEINLKPSDSGKTGFTGKSGPSSDCDISQSKEDKFSSPHPEKSAGSESSRGFEPEGSVDMSPSYSESGGSGSAATSHPTPPFVKWRDGIGVLLEDQEGTNLFTQYLEEQNLAHYLTFLIICRGFKKNATTDADITDIIKAVYKRYINPKSSTKQNFRIDCIDTETKASIESKLKSLDKNIFDGAVNLVETHLATKFYPNFLTSDLFVEYVRAYQQNEPESRISAASSISGSRMTRDPQDDSGMEEDRGAFSSSKSSTVPMLNSSDPHGVLAPDSLRMSSASTTTCNSSVFNSTGFLPTVEEERELRLDPVLTTPSKGSVQSLQSIVKTPQGASSSLSSRMVQLDSSFPPPASSSRTARLKANELHPSLMSSVAATAVPDIRSASYAYHANSSNWNPVSRQDSELQSQSSGAVGGDTTDDNYSTFTDIQQQQQQNATAKKLHDKKLEQRRHLREFQKIERASQQMREDPNSLLPPKNLDKQLMMKSREGQPNPEKDIDEFARLLISKLAAHRKDLDDKKLLQEKLGQVGDGDSSVASLGPYTADQQRKKRYPQQLAVFGSRSQGDPLDAESDQSILDDHVSRIFNKGGTDTPPGNEFVRYNRIPNVSANTSSMFDTSRRSINTSMSGHSTLPVRSRAAAGYQHYGHQMSSSVSQQTYHPQYRSGQYHTGSTSMTMDSSRTGAGTSKSLIDMSLVGPASHPPAPGSSYSAGGQHHESKVGTWLNHQTQFPPTSSSGLALTGADHSMSRISPRSSGRYSTSASARAKSQDRSGSYSHHGMFGMSQSFSGSQYPSVDPSYLASRLQHEQSMQQQHHHQTRHNMMTSSASLLSGSNISMASSGSLQHPAPSNDPKVITTVVYRFPQDKDDMPYRVKIHSAHPTLLDIKQSIPKKGNNYRFYFKTKVDGEACFEQEINELVPVPMWEGSIVVHCRND